MRSGLICYTDSYLWILQDWFWTTFLSSFLFKLDDLNNNSYKDHLNQFVFLQLPVFVLMCEEYVWDWEGPTVWKS